MEHRLPSFSLVPLAAVLAAAASTSGLLWPDSTATIAEFTSLHGESVTLWRHGLYRSEAVFFAAGFRGQDLVTLTIAVPALLAASWKSRRVVDSSWLLVRITVLAYLGYAYGTMALGAFYNELFLLYVAVLSTSLFAFGFDLHELSTVLSGRWEKRAALMPHRRTALLLLVCGVGTGLLWVLPLVGALLGGLPPPLLFHATTKVTEALDLAVIVPSCIVGAGLIWRGAPTGYLFGVPLLGLIVMLFPTILASTASQLTAGIEFTLPEIAGPIGCFLLFGALGALILWRVGSVLARPLDNPYEHELESAT